jgi:hypothetical protein
VHAQHICLTACDRQDQIDPASQGRCERVGSRGTIAVRVGRFHRQERPVQDRPGHSLYCRRPHQFFFGCPVDRPDSAKQRRHRGLRRLRSSSQWTLSWRERDSNHRSPVSGSHRWNDRVAHGAASLTQPATASSPTSPARSVPRNARRGAGPDSHRERGGACSCASACMSAMSWSTVTTCSAIASTLRRARHGRRSSALRQRYHRH